MTSKTIYEFEGKTFDTLKEFYEWGAKNVVHGSIFLEAGESTEVDYATIYLPSNQIKNFKEEYKADSLQDFEAQFSEYFYNYGSEISEGRMIYDPFWVDKEQALYFFIAVVAEEHLKLTEQIEYHKKQIYGLYEGKKYIAPCYVLSSDKDTAKVQYLDGKTEEIDTTKLELKSVSLANSNR